MIRILIADDHHLVRQGIRALLERAPDIEVVGEAATGPAALEEALRLRPDVLLSDINMPGLTGIQLAEQLGVAGVEAAVVLLSVYSDTSLVNEALQRGVRGYVLKRGVSEELLAAIRTAVRGRRYLSPELAPLATACSSPHATSRRFERLTAREREVLKLLAEGETNQSTANRLGISVKTVESHRSNLMQKLGVWDLPGLVRTAIRHGLIFVEEE